jgi:hypothetical protein
MSFEKKDIYKCNKNLLIRPMLATEFQLDVKLFCQFRHGFGGDNLCLGQQ